MNAPILTGISTSQHIDTMLDIQYMVFTTITDETTSCRSGLLPDIFSRLP